MQGVPTILKKISFTTRNKKLMYFMVDGERVGKVSNKRQFAEVLTV